MVTVRLTPPKKIVFRLSLILGIVAIIMFVFALLISYNFVPILSTIDFADWIFLTLAFHIMLLAFGLICAGAAFKGF